MSSIVLFETLPRVSIKQGRGIPGRNGMLMGLMSFGDYDTRAILICEDGSVSRAELDDFLVDFHYDAETDQWKSLHAADPTAFGSETDQD